MNKRNIIKSFPTDWEIGKYYDFVSKKELNDVCRAHAGFFHTLFGKNERFVLLPVEIAGAVQHHTNLIKKINNKQRLGIGFVDVRSFEGEKNTGEQKITNSPKLPKIVENADIVLVDVIYDSGRTIDRLFEYLTTFNPKSISVCIVISKQTREQIIDSLRKYELFREVSPFISVPEGLFYQGYGLDEERCLPMIQAKIPF